MSRPPDNTTTPQSRSRPPEGPGKLPDAWGGFEPYAQLCRSLLPRTHGVSIFDVRGALRWSNDAAAAALGPLVNGALAVIESAPESAGELHVLPGDAPVYLCWIRDDARHVLACVAIACSPGSDRDAESRSFALVHPLLKPALECFRRDLLARITIGRLKRAVTELKARQEEEDGSYDTLTGLYTRPAFEHRVRAAVARPDNTSGWSSLYINVDQLHVINDNFGMPVGDSVLGQLGELLRSRLPAGAFAARISGDRFSVLLPAHLDDAERFGESLREGAEQLGNTEGNSRLRVSISVGVAALDASEGELMHSFAAAETACKAAKDRGRNRVEVYRANDVSLVRRFADINIAGQLHDAISAGRLSLDAQLILPFHRGGPLKPHYELLVRMIDEDGTAALPDTFMSAAIRYQLMQSIDRWVIETAVQRLKTLAGTLASVPLSFAINFSGQSLNDESFSDFLVERIRSSGLPPDLFCFELTENATIASIARARDLMGRLRSLGCGIALDDFGTGLSSLSYLRQLPVTMLKIDGSFVRDVVRDPRAESMVRAIAQLAHAMSLTTVAEYVETDEIRARIATLGVDYGQGFGISRPMPLDDLLARLAKAALVGAQRRSTDGVRVANPVSPARSA
ncbi:MAG TPA: bifunctional diguanylate cyclase/phosphodiesterase [Steroidobacteraceae bacterium]|nr:bifunctional diguanylate cyclase/phosphodiesterase [Steroidobacteraceae bacterium]